MKALRGEDPDPGSVFRYVPLVKRIPSDHPLRPMREMVDVALPSISPQLDYNLLFRNPVRTRTLLAASG